MVNGLQVVAVSLVLGLTFRQQCDGLARYILAAYVVVLIPKTIVLLYHYRRPLEIDVFGREIAPREGPAKWMYLLRELSNFLTALVLVLTAFSLFDTGCIKTAPALYWTMVAVLLLNSLYFIVPLLLLLMLFMCLPCVIIGLRWMYPAPNRGASEAAIARVPSFEYSTGAADRVYGGIRVEEADATCTICLQEYANGVRIRVLPCHHHFHKACADEWFRLQGTCPLCVQPIVVRDDKPNDDAGASEEAV